MRICSLTFLELWWHWSACSFLGHPSRSFKERSVICFFQYWKCGESLTGVGLLTLMWHRVGFTDFLWCIEWMRKDTSVFQHLSRCLILLEIYPPCEKNPFVLTQIVVLRYCSSFHTKQAFLWSGSSLRPQGDNLLPCLMTQIRCALWQTFFLPTAFIICVK